MRNLAGIFGTLGLFVACSGGPDGSTQTASPDNRSTLQATAAGSTPAANGSLPPGVLAGGTTWTSTAGQFGTQQGSRFLFQCPPGGSAAKVWGTDTYTADSSVCTAAVHVGKIGFAGGGAVVIEIRPGQQTYAGSERNGVTSSEYGSWGASFAFVDVLLPPPTRAGVTSTPTAGAVVPTPSGTPATGAPLGFGADAELFTDDFSDATGAWQVYSGDGGSIAYDPAGVLKAQVVQNVSLSSLAATAIDAVAWDVVRVEATMTAETLGTATYVGLLCGASTEDFIGGALGTNALWAFLRKSGTDFHGIGFATGLTPLSLAQPVRMRLECAGTNTGSVRMQLWVNDILVSTHEGDDGPAAFNNIGIYVEGDGNSILIDDVAAYGGTAATLPPPQTVPTPLPVGTPSGSSTGNVTLDALLTHVPDVMRQNCGLTTSFDLGAQVQTQCLPDHLDGYATYTQFDTVDNLRAAFLDQVDFFGDGTVGSDCAAGPAQQIYSIANAPVGRLMCNSYDDGLIAIWTDESLRIDGHIVFHNVDFAALYSTWLTAGPI